MINKINLGFGNERSFLKKEKIIKIYNNGNIITSRPKSSKNEYRILSIKKYESPKIIIKKENSAKKKKKRIEEKKLEINEDENNNGYILGDLIKDEEFKNIMNFENDLSKEKIKLNKKKEEKEKNKKIKPYIPDIQYNEEKEINERYLKRTINIFKENEYLINRINELLKRSKVINEQEIKKEKERKLAKINADKSNIKNFINNKRKEIKENNDIKFLTEVDNLNADNIENNSNKDKKEENKNNDKIKNKKNSNINIKKINNQNEFVDIIDIKQDIKYIEAEGWLKNSKEDCEKVKDLIIKIDQQIKENKNEINNTE